MRTLLTCIFLFLCLGHLAAQQPLRYDTSVIAVRSFSPSAMKGYQNDPQFQYERVKEPPNSLWDRFWAWFWSRINRIFDSKVGGTVFYWVMIGLAISVIVLFIIRVNRMTDGMLFGKNNQKEQLKYTSGEEDIHTIPFEEAISQAVKEKNFRLAVRLLYLQSLKNLSDKGEINWQFNKTNLAYWHELSGTVYEQPFLELTRHFENNWYGNQPARETDFPYLSNLFSDFNIQLTN